MRIVKLLCLLIIASAFIELKAGIGGKFRALLPISVLFG